jgi:long-chain fatty acid transport protein
MIMRKITLLILLFSLGTVSLLAGGYQVRLQGQKQTSIGLIGTPFAFDASGIFYNPGSLSFIKEKYSFSGGVSGIFSKIVFRSKDTDYTARTDNKMSTPFYFYGSAKITDDLTVGAGVFTPYGSSTTWDDDWHGKYIIQNIALSAVFIQPTISYKFMDKIGIGAGLDIVTGSVDLNQQIPAPVQGKVNLNGKSTAFGFNVGGYFRPIEALNIGIDYRSKVNMKVDEGDVEFTDIPTAVAADFPADEKFSAELPLPANLDVGLSYQLTKKFLLAAEMNYIFWSVYDSLIIDFKENNETLSDARNPRDYENSIIFRLGGEFKFSEKFTARAGVYYDPTPTNKDYFTPETVSLDQIAFTLGISYMPVKGLNIDLSYLQLEGGEAEKSYSPENFTGTYRSRAFVPGIGLSYNF